MWQRIASGRSPSSSELTVDVFVTASKFAPPYCTKTLEIARRHCGSVPSTKYMLVKNENTTATCVCVCMCKSWSEPVAETSPFRVEPARLYSSPFLSFLAVIKLRIRLRGIAVGMNSAGILQVVSN